MSRVLVTGGAGFIGSHVVDALVRDDHVVAVVDDLSTGRAGNLADAGRTGNLTGMHELDILEPAAALVVEDFRPDVVMLLAAQMSVKVSMRDPILDARVNVEGLLRMLEAARRCGARKVVFASSGGTIYGEADPTGPRITEDHPRVPNSFYGITKSVAVDYLRLYREAYGIDYVVMALGNAYGPRQSPYGEAGLVAIFAQRMLLGEPCVINGDGKTTRDYVHVSDVARAFVAATERGSGLVNIGSGIDRSVLDMHTALSRAVGYQLPPVFGPPLPGEVWRVRMDVRRAASELGWRATVGLADGMATVIDWLRAEGGAGAGIGYR
jgi:UDP-glucose 4-epimerase